MTGAEAIATWLRAFVVGTLLALAAGGTASAQDDCPFEAGPKATVAHAIDGETVALADGSEVRLLSILADDAPSGGGAESAVDALEALAGGSEAQLFFSGRRQDRRGRWLAHVFVARGAERVWVQADLVQRGLARVATFAETRACVRRLQALEEQAREARLGLWRAGKAAVVPAWQTKTLLGRLNAFQIVEGRVAAVARTRQWTFVNFDADWRHDFTVAIAARDRRLFEGSDVDLDKLEGRRVRVRGWIESWNGPVIKATHPEQIEVLGNGAEPTPASAQGAQLPKTR